MSFVVFYYILDNCVSIVPQAGPDSVVTLTTIFKASKIQKIKVPGELLLVLFGRSEG